MKKRKNKVKRYINLAKENPQQALYDFLNTVLVIGVIFVLICFVKWVISVFKGATLINPIALSFNSIHIYWYGILFAVSFLLGFLYIYRRTLKIKQDINIVIKW